MLTRRTRHPDRRRRGGTLVKVLLTLVVIVGVAALNLDGGRMMDERRRAQAAADAAALAAGNTLYTNHLTDHGTDPLGVAEAAAVQAAAAFGYPPAAVSVHIPPLTGPFAGQPGYAEVTISSTLDASFGRVFTGNGLEVGARAVARGEPLKIGVILLRPNGAAAFHNIAATFTIINKPLVVNSTDPAALTSTGLTMLSISRVDVTGGVSNSSVLSASTRVRTGVRPTADPLATLPIPDAAAAPVRSLTPLTVNSLVPVALQPGVYRGGIRVTGLSVVVMNAGTYIMEGGGFRVDTAATVTGLGVTVYNTTSGSYPAGPISISGAGRVVLTAPLSGAYQGISFFQNRALTQPVSLTGLGLTTITGTVYAAKAAVNLTGGAAVGLDILGGAFVAESMTVSGAGAVTVSLGLHPPRVPDVRLTE